MRRNLGSSLLAVFLVHAAWGTPVPIQYTVTTKGTGPGITLGTSQATVTAKQVAQCAACQSIDPDRPYCIQIIGDGRVLLKDIVSVPVGDWNVDVTVTGGPLFAVDGNWNWGTDTCSDQICPGLFGGAETGCGSGGSSCHFQAREPFGWGFYSNMFLAVESHYTGGGTCSVFYCALACFVGGDSCCGKAGDQMTTVVTYKKSAPDAPKSCTQSGTGFVEPDALWHLVASATCMRSPDTATGWTGSAASQDASYQAKAVMTSVNPNASGTPFAPGPDL